MNRGNLILVASLCLMTTLSVPLDAKVVYVDPSVPVSGDGTTPLLAFKTITDAINDATTVDGDTLTLSPGTYAESDIPVSKWLIIEGAGSGTTPATETIIDGTTTGGADGFDLLVGGNSATEQLVFRDLRVMSQPNRAVDIDATISDVVFENVVFDSNGTHGVMITDAAVVSDILFDNCTFTNNPEGMRVDGSLDKVTFEGGAFDGNVVGFTATQQVPPTAATALTNVTFEQTSFLNNTNKGFHTEKLSDAVFDRVVVENCGSAGVATSGIDIDLKWDDYSDISFISPTIDNCGWGDLTEGGGLLIRAHDEPPTYTPRPATLDGVSIEGGSITNCSVNGLWVGTRNKANSTPLNVKVNRVEFDGNATNSLINETSQRIDARYNYWGDSSGPVALFVDPYYGLYFGGSGENIAIGLSVTATAEVLYTPFWLAPEGTGTVYVDSDFTGFTGSDPTGSATFVGGDAVRTMDEGYNNVAAGGTLIFTDDLYPAPNFRLDRPITLQGETQAGTIIFPRDEDGHNDDFTGGNPQHCLIISSNDVSIENLTIDGQANPGLTVGKNNFRTGIMTDSSVTTGLGNLVVQDVTVKNIYLRGISLTGQGTNWLIDTVTVDNVESMMTLPSGEGGLGIYTADGDGTIVDCQVTNAPIGIAVAESMTVIEDNQISGARFGLYLTTDDYDTELEADDPILAVVMGNTISARETGIFAEKVADGTEIGSATSGDGNNINMTPSGTEAGIGIRLTNPFGQAIIQNNQILGSGDDSGIWVYRVPDSLDRVLINNNVLVSSASAASFWHEGNGVLLTDESSLFGGTDSPVYASLRGNSIQGFVNGINLSRRATSVAGGFAADVIIGGSSASASNTISYCGNGITVYEDDAANNGGFLATATIDGNVSSIINCVVGIDVNGGSAAVTNNSIYNNGVGVKVSGGGTITDLGDINFDDPTDNVSEPDADQDNVIDLQLIAGAGPVSISSGNAFAADRVAPFQGAGPATAYYVDNQSSQNIDLTSGATFDGFAPGAMSLDDLFDAEDKINHGVDIAGAGIVRLRAGNVYVTPSGSIENAASAASDGDIVNIADGTYIASNTTITKSVALVGESRDGVIIAPEAVDDRLDSVAGGAVQNGLIIQADNVFVRDLTIDGEANNVGLGELADANNFRTGILQDYSSLYNASQIENCVITGCYRRGIQLGTFSSAVGVSTNNVVEFCDINDIDLRQGVVLSGNGAIVNNTISDLGKVSSGVDYLGTGIYTEGYDVTITGNTISDFSLSGIRHYPDRYSEPDVITISGNTIQTPKDLYDGVYGLDLDGLDFGSQIGGPLPADGNLIDLITADNTWDRVGIFLTHSSEQIIGSLAVQNNTISVAGDGAGIWMLANTVSSSPVALLDNTLTSAGASSAANGTATGVYIFDDGSLVGEANGGGYATLTGNTIDGFDIGLHLDSAVNEVINVTVGDVAGNTISNGTYGIYLQDIDSYVGAPTVMATIAGNTATINGFSIAGILVDGSDAVIRDNTVYDNAVGVLVRSGGTATLDGNSFVGGTPNVVDLKTEVTAGDIAVSDSARNDFAGSTYFIEHWSAQDWDGTVNRFDVASGLTYPGAMSAAERITLQNKVFHQPDNGPSGLISFDYTLKPETWVDDEWAGELPGNPVTRPDGVNLIFGDTAFDTIADALTKTLRTGVVHIIDGTYNEANLVLDKPVTIQGYDRDDVILGPVVEDDLSDSTYGGTVQNGFIIDSNNVTIDSLTIDGLASNTLMATGHTNFRQGVVTAETPSGSLADVTLSNLLIKNIYRRGLHLTAQSEGWLIDQVEIDNVVDTSFLDGTGQGGFGFFIVDIDGTISNNVIRDADVGLVLAHGEMVLTGNTVSRGRRGVWLTYSDYDGPSYDNSAIQNVGGFSFSVAFDETRLQPVSGISENVSTSPIQFEQLLTSDVGGGRLNIIGALTDPANTSFNGDLFEIEFQNLGTPLTSSDGTGLPDSLILSDNDFVAPPHLVELDAGSTPIPHIFVRGNDSLPSTTNISYHVIGDALTPGSIFKVRATLNGATSNPVMADIKGNVFSGSEQAMALNAVGDGITIGGSDPADSNIFTVVASGFTSATGLHAQYSQGQVTIENNEFLCDGNDNGIVLFKNESAVLPVMISDNTVEALTAYTSAVDQSNGIWITDDGSFFGEEDGACYAELTANTITGFNRGISVLRSGSVQTGGEILDVTIGGDTANVANDISGCGTGIYINEIDGASNGGYRCRASVNGNAAIFNNDENGIWVDGASVVIEKSVVRNNLNVGMRIDNEAQVDIFDSCFFGNLSFSIVNNNSSAKVVDTTNVYWGASDGPAPFGSGFSVLGDFNFISLGYFCGLYNQAITSAGGSFVIPAAFNDRYLLHAVEVPALDNDGTLRLISPRDRHGVDNAVEVEIAGANILGTGTITVQYDRDTDMGLSEREIDMRLHRWDGASWIPDLNSTVNTGNNTVTGEFSQEGIYAVINIPGTTINDWNLFK